jgi:hypothetical protein
MEIESVETRMDELIKTVRQRQPALLVRIAEYLQPGTYDEFKVFNPRSPYIF